MSLLRPGPPVIASVPGFLAIERALETGTSPGVLASEDPPMGQWSCYPNIRRSGDTALTKG